MACAPESLPGALWVEPDDLPRRLRELPRDVMVVLYGRRPKPAQHVGLWLRGAGLGTVRPLAGGLHAWRRRGYPVQAAPPEAREVAPGTYFGSGA